MAVVRPVEERPKIRGLGTSINDRSLERHRERESDGDSDDELVSPFASGPEITRE